MDIKTINKLIKQFDKKQLQELVIYLVSANKSVGETLLDYCQKKDAAAKADNHTLIIENKVRQHWNKASKIIEKFDMYGGGPEKDEDDAYSELEAMENLLEDNEVSWIIRKEILDQILHFVESDNSGFADYLMDIAVEMCTNKQENIYLADFLIENANTYYKRVAAEIYLKNGEEQKFIEIKKANLQYSSDYLDLAAYYNEQNDEETALKIVLEGLNSVDGRLDEIYKYLFWYYEENANEAALEKLLAESEKRKRDQDTITELMYQYYKRKGDYNKQKKALFTLISCCNEGRLYELYQKCRQELTEKDFSKEEQEILKMIKKRKLSVYFDILIDKNETKEIIEYIIQNQQYREWGIDYNHCFSKRLSKEYPREIVEMYWKEAAFYVSLGKERNYSDAVKVLKEIRTIMKKNKWTEEWDTKYKAFVADNKRKKLLLRLLEGFEA